MGASLRTWSKAAIGLYFTLLVACGPVEYISQVTLRAGNELAAAKAAGGDKYAPYEYTSAVEYLHKAREEEGYARHQVAIRFGKKATTMARKAKQIALSAAGSEVSSDGPIDPSASPPTPKSSEPGR